MSFPITIALSSLLALWLLVLSLNVSRARGDASVSLGDGGDKPLLRRIRAQANFVEYVPIMIVLFGIGEYLQTNVYFLGGMAALFFLGRLAHGYALSFSSNNPPARMFGASATFIVLLVLPISNLVVAFWI